MVLKAVIQPSLSPLPTPVPMVSPGQTLQGVLGRLANSTTDGHGAWYTAAATIQGQACAKGVANRSAQGSRGFCHVEGLSMRLHCSHS